MYSFCNRWCRSSQFVKGAAPSQLAVSRVCREANSSDPAHVAVSVGQSFLAGIILPAFGIMAVFPTFEYIEQMVCKVRVYSLSVPARPSKEELQFLGPYSAVLLMTAWPRANI
jgi:hypothetical protein